MPTVLRTKLLRSIVAAALAWAATLAAGAAAADDPLLKLHRDSASAMRAGRWTDALAMRAELIRRVEGLRAATTNAAARRALVRHWLPSYREHAAMLAIAGRGREAYAATELAKARLVLDLSAARHALDAGPLPREKAALLEALRAPAIDELRALLPPRTVYLGYLLQSNLLMVTALSTERPGRIHRAPVPPRLSASIAAWRFLLAIPGEWREKIGNLPGVWRRADGSFQVASRAPEAGAAPVEDPAEIAAYLGERLLAPVADDLASVDRVIVSPDADLAFLPFEALRLKGRHLVESHDVQYTAAAGMYALSRARAAEQGKLAGRAGLLSVGGALYEAYVQVTPMLSVHHDLLYALPRSLQARGGGKPEEPRTVSEAFQALKVSWANLPGTTEEAGRIAALFERSRALTGADASEERLLELDRSGELARYRHLFFATHGYLSPYDPRLSSVVLSQIGNRSPHDGYVTAAEWPRYTLKSDLVVLSAANSGFGPAASAEGVLGLPFSLHLAGNRNTVLSLWTLNEPATAQFIEAFFARVRRGEEHAKALSDTKRSFLAEGRHPSTWAPFVLHGG